VLPTLNERATITDLILSGLQHVSDCQIIVVDDDSRDGTAEAVQDPAARFPSILLRCHMADPTDRSSTGV
jgi:glycosyltransferase involved in cell wall biosynthesis